MTIGKIVGGLLGSGLEGKAGGIQHSQHTQSDHQQAQHSLTSQFKNTMNSHRQGSAFTSAEPCVSDQGTRQPHSSGTQHHTSSGSSGTQQHHASSGSSGTQHHASSGSDGVQHSSQGGIHGQSDGLLNTVSQLKMKPFHLFSSLFGHDGAAKAAQNGDLMGWLVNTQDHTSHSHPAGGAEGQGGSQAPLAFLGTIGQKAGGAVGLDKLFGSAIEYDKQNGTNYARNGNPHY